MANRPLLRLGKGDVAMVGQPGFFDSDERLQALSAAGDPLERLAAVVDFEVFRSDLIAALSRSDQTKGAHSGDCDRPFRPKVITYSGDHDHAIMRPKGPA